MSLFKLALLIVAILFAALTAGAASSFQRDSIGVSKVIWNERLRAVQLDHIDHGVATYSSYVLGWDRAWIDGRWGFGLGAMYGQGHAVAGDFDGSVDFPDAGNRSFTIYALNPRVIYRHSGQVHLSLVAPFIYRTIQWDPSANEDVHIEARRTLSLTLGPEIRVLLTGEWEILGGVSILSGASETYWRMGLHYRL